MLQWVRVLHVEYMEKEEKANVVLFIFLRKLIVDRKSGSVPPKNLTKLSNITFYHKRL